MTKKEQTIENFIHSLRYQNVNDFDSKIEGDLGNILTEFSVSCKKCNSYKIFVSWEQGTDYGKYTGYASAQKLFKCIDCGNSASFWE